MIRLSITVAVMIFSFTVSAEDNPIDCVNQIISWCEKQDYTGTVSGNSIMSTSDTAKNGEYRNVYCTTNTYGTICQSNNEAWYSCSQDHEATYKNNPLQKDSADGTDDEICYTAEKASRNQYNSKEAKRRVEETMKEVNENLRPLREPCFPFCQNGLQGNATSAAVQRAELGLFVFALFFIAYYFF